MQDIFFSSDRPQFMNYGAIGTIIGHEINHGFDTIGRTYDKQGDLVNWWSEEAKNRYLEKTMCILNQYENYTAHEVGLKVCLIKKTFLKSKIYCFYVERNIILAYLS